MSKAVNLEEIIKSEEIEAVIAEGVRKGVAAAIERSFSYNGALNKAVSDRVEEVIVPALDKYDFSKYTVKLEEVLSSILDSTTLVDNRNILHNFERLMSEPPEDTITLERLFDIYQSYVANNVDCSELEVDLDDKPTYQYVLCHAEIEDVDKPSWFSSSREEARLYLRTEEDEDISFEIDLERWNHDRKEGWEIKFAQQPNITRLRYLDDFTVLLMQLSRAGVRLTFDSRHLEESVEPNQEPECEWR